MKLLRLMLAILIFVVISPLSGQIVIDWTEIPQTLGTEWTKNNKYDVTVDLGSTGGGQTWNFTSQPMGSENSNSVIVLKSSTPFPDSFPDANLVYKSAEDGDTSYLFMKLTSSFWCTFGLCDTGIVMIFDPRDSIPLPVTYGSSHQYHYGFEFEEPPITVRTEWYGRTTIDAWGTVTIPYGTFPCLRERSYDTCAVTTFISSIPMFGDTVTHINHAYIGENYGGLVCIKSQPDETNPNYTDAAILERITYFSPGIEELRGIQTNALSCGPNPFSDYVELKYSIIKPSHIELTFYDINGRLVKTMVNEPQQKGNYTVKWFGKNETGNPLPNGIYFYRLNVDGSNSIGKVLLINK